VIPHIPLCSLLQQSDSYLVFKVLVLQRVFSLCYGVRASLVVRADCSVSVFLGLATVCKILAPIN